MSRREEFTNKSLTMLKNAEDAVLGGNYENYYSSTAQTYATLAGAWANEFKPDASLIFELKEIKRIWEEGSHSYQDAYRELLRVIDALQGAK